MQPYPVRDNDYVLKLASKFGFDPDAVWNHPSNADLRQLRANPNVMLGGDVLYIPDQDAPLQSHDLVTGSTNTFSAPDPPKAQISVRFVGPTDSTYASKAYTLVELPDLSGLTTDGTGLATFEIPVTLDTITLVFTDGGESHTLVIGGLNPIDTPSGLFQRLQHLGHIGAMDFDADTVENNIDPVRVALCALQGGESGRPVPGSYPSETAMDPSASPPGADDPSWAEQSGLKDDWTLVTDVQTQLESAHGC